MEEYETERRLIEEEIGYKDYLLKKYIEMCELATRLRKSYIEGRSDRETHFQLVSLIIELWLQILPKVQGRELENRLRRYTVFYINPILFFQEGYEKLLWMMIFDLRYAALDACQSVVMYYYKEQPDAKKLPKFLEKLVNEGKLEKEYIGKFTELNKLWKDIDHGIIKEVTPDHLKRAYELAKDIVERMKKLLPEDIEDYLK